MHRKKIFVFFTLLNFCIICLTCLQVNAAKVPVYKYEYKKVIKKFPYEVSYGFSDFYYEDFKFQDIKSSNEAVATVKYDKEINDIVVKVKKPGKCTVSYKFIDKDRNLSYIDKNTYTFYKWTNPVELFKIGDENYKSRFNKKEDVVAINRPTGRLQVKLGSNYKLENISYGNPVKNKPREYIKNGSQVVMTRYDDIQVNYTDKRTNENSSLSLFCDASADTPTNTQIASNSFVLNSNIVGKWTKENYLKVTWGKVKGAAGYEIYVRKCDGNDLWEKVTYTVKNGKTSATTIKKVGGKKFSKTANYKYGVRAYKYIRGEKVYIAKSLSYHFIGSKNWQLTNAKNIIANKKAITLGVKNSFKLSSKVTKLQSNRKLIKHDTLVRYISSNPSVAKVGLRTGKVLGVKKGTCKIYCIALNGVKTTVSVTVK